MNIINVLEGIEKLVVDLLLWIIFIPKTLFRIIAEPDWVSGYIEEQLAKKSERFDDYISPILLFLSSSVVLLTIGNQADLDVANVPNPEKILNELKGTTGILAGLGFLSLPLLFALAIELFRPEKLTRKSIQRTLYIQCFYFSPLTLSILSFFLLEFLLPEEDFVILPATIVLMLGIAIWFPIVQVKLIARELQSGILKAIGILLASTIIAIAGGLFLLFATGGSQIDAFAAGETEEIPDLSLPNSGQFSISIEDYNNLGGTYRLTLTEADESGEPEALIQPDATDSLPGTGSLTYGQFVDGQVTEGIASVWTFNGSEGDFIEITVEPLDQELDPMVDVLDSSGSSILAEEGPNYTVGIGYVYILVIGLAIILGYRSLLRKSKKPVNRDEKPQTP